MTMIDNVPPSGMESFTKPSSATESILGRLAVHIVTVKWVIQQFICLRTRRVISARSASAEDRECLSGATTKASAAPPTVSDERILALFLRGAAPPSNVTLVTDLGHRGVLN